MPARPGAHLLDAVLAVIAERGLAAASMRTVARAAGVSLAQVQYYFRTKEELISAGFGYASELFLDSLGTDLPGEPSWPGLRATTVRWLPLDAERERLARVWLAYAATAVTSERLAPECARVDAYLRNWYRAQLDALARAGHVRQGVDTAGAAARLFALIDGVTTQALVLPVAERADLVERTVDPFLAGLAAGENPLG